MANLNFDASTVAPAEAAEAIPAGWYPAQMSASEMKPTANGQGAYLSCEYTILEGDCKGRKQFDRINLQNSNPTAVEIGYRTLSAICHATGVIQVQDSAQLHGRPLMIKVAVRAAQTTAQSKDGKDHEASNEIKGYKAYTQMAQMAPAAFAPPPMPAPAMAPPAAWAPPQPQQAWQQPAPPQTSFAPPVAPQPAQVPAQQPGWAAAPAPQQFAPAPQAVHQGYAPPPVAAPQEAAPMPPWAGQPAPVAQPNVATPAPAAAAAPTPPWATAPAA